MRNMHPSYPQAIGIERRLELRPDEAVSVPAARGTLVHCVRGPIWLTQEGLWQDYILVEGTQFVSGGNGKIVLNALDGAGQALIYSTESGAASGLTPGIHIGHDVIERVTREARHAQIEEISCLLARLGTAAWRALLALARRFGNVPPRQYPSSPPPSGRK